MNEILDLLPIPAARDFPGDRRDARRDALVAAVRADVPGSTPVEERSRKVDDRAPRQRGQGLRAWRSRRPSVAMAAAVVAAVVAVLLVSPWSGGGGLVQRALAAVGTGPVLHVVTEQPSSSWRGIQPVSLPSGTPIQVTQRQEIWFDQSRDLKKTARP